MEPESKPTSQGQSFESANCSLPELKPTNKRLFHNGMVEPSGRDQDSANEFEELDEYPRKMDRAETFWHLVDLVQNRPKLRLGCSSTLHSGPFDEPDHTEYSNVLQAIRQLTNISNGNPARNTSFHWDAQLQANFVWAVNLHIPSKLDRTAYFTWLHRSTGDRQNFTLPVRNAQVILFAGAKSPPLVEEFLVGPMHRPRVIRQLASIPFHKRPLGAVEYGALEDFVTLVCARLDPVIRQAYEASFFRSHLSSSWPQTQHEASIMHNFRRVSQCRPRYTRPHPKGDPSCLTMMFASPLVTVEAPGRRRIWIRLNHQVAPFIQYPVDLQIEIDHTSLNVREWYVETIWFQNHFYFSVNKLLNQFESGHLKTTSRPFVDLYPGQMQPTSDTESSDESAKRPSASKRSRKHKIQTKPESSGRFDKKESNSRYSTENMVDKGPEMRNKLELMMSQNAQHDQMLRYQYFKECTSKPRSSRHIYIQERRIIYNNWDFHVTVRRDTGLRVYGVYFAGKSIIAEAGLDETVTAYWGASPFMRTMTSLETMYGVGGMAGELKPGIDCPKDAIFMPVQVVPSGDVGPKRIAKGICVFEWTVDSPGGPARRHTEFVDGSDDQHTNFAFGAPGRGLVVRMIASLFNYDYLFDVVLSSSGTIEFAVTPTGYVHVDTFPFDQENDLPAAPLPWHTPEAYGFRATHFPITFVAHHHLFHFKVDLDVLSRRNYLKVVSVDGSINSPEGVKLKQGPGRRSEFIVPALWMQTRVVEHEADARFNVRFDHPKQYLVCEYEEDAKKARRNPQCVIVSNHAAIKTVFSDEHTRSFAWSRNQLIVTKQRENESYASSVFNGVDLTDPVVDFTKFGANNESILGEDLVLWMTVGNYHLPRQEDLPNTPTNGGRLYFNIKPHNLFKYSPDAYNCDRFFTNNLEEWLAPKSETSGCTIANIPGL